MATHPYLSSQKISDEVMRVKTPCILLWMLCMRSAFSCRQFLTCGCHRLTKIGRSHKHIETDTKIHCGKLATFKIAENALIWNWCLNLIYQTMLWCYVAKCLTSISKSLYEEHYWHVLLNHLFGWQKKVVLRINDQGKAWLSNGPKMAFFTTSWSL